MSVSLRRRPFLLGNTTAQTYEDEPPSPGGTQATAANPMHRRGTNDFAATNRQPPNAGAPVGGGANNLTMGQQPAQAPQPKEKVNRLVC